MLAPLPDQRARVHRALEIERERSERLLLNVLMVAGGVPQARLGHMQAVARMALATREDIVAIAARGESRGSASG